MRTFRIVIVDGRGSTTQEIQAAGNYGMEDAIKIALGNHPYTNAGIISVTATII